MKPLNKIIIQIAIAAAVSASAGYLLGTRVGMNADPFKGIIPEKIESISIKTEKGTYTISGDYSAVLAQLRKLRNKPVL